MELSPLRTADWHLCIRRRVVHLTPPFTNSLRRYRKGPGNQYLLPKFSESGIRPRATSSSRESVVYAGPSRYTLTVNCRTSSKAERLEEYLAIPSLPDLTEDEVKLIDDIGKTHFFHLYVSSLLA